MHFYTSVARRGSSILTRQIKNGRRLNIKEKFQPTLFLESQTDVGIRSLDGRSLQPRHFSSVFEAKEFVKQFEDVSNLKIYGNKNFEYQWVSETFRGEIDFDYSLLKIWSLDIETTVSGAFPDIEFPTEVIQLISIQDIITKDITTFGLHDYEPSTVRPNHTYVYCRTEAALLESFMRFWETDHPNIVTGWNVQFFDMPYLVNRINVILGSDAANRLSPWGNIDRRDVQVMGRNNISYNIIGVNTIDYMDLYKRFPYPRPSESYRLDYISEVELDQNKLENPFSTFREFYEKDWNRFVDYNIHDVVLVSMLEDKMKLIELIVTMAYQAKCNFSDILSAVRTWHCTLHNYMYEHNIYAEIKQNHNSSSGIQGGYVKEPIPGKYKWPVSFDAASLYPSIMMSWNMSPETIVNDRKLDIDMTKLLSKEYQFDELHAIAANGHLFRKDVKGIFPTIVSKIFNDRVINKKKMSDAQKEYEKTGQAELLKVISKYNNYQMSAKILLNSLYGAQANEYFMFFDPRIAEGITITGQYIIRQVGEALNIELNKLFETSGITYTIYQDTDSCFVTLGPMVDKFFSNKSTEEVVAIIDKICKDKIEPILKEACNDLTSYMCAHDQRISFKRETISNVGVWTGKKRYAVNVYDNEGVRYSEPKLKVMGLEIIKSSTPSNVRKWLKESLNVFLKSDEPALHAYVKDVESWYRKLPVEDISFPRGVNNIGKYTDPNKIYLKGCPIHVRAALMFNNMIKAADLSKDIQPIEDGDKIKFVYLKKPNIIGEDVIGFRDNLPKEFNLTKYVDYDKMFSKSFIEPLNNMVSTVGWTTSPKATLEGLFGEE